MNLDLIAEKLAREKNLSREEYFNSGLTDLYPVIWDVQIDVFLEGLNNTLSSEKRLLLRYLGWQGDLRVNYAVFANHVNKELSVYNYELSFLLKYYNCVETADGVSKKSSEQSLCLFYDAKAIYHKGPVFTHLEGDFFSKYDNLNIGRLFSILQSAYKIIEDSTRIQD